MNPVDLLTGGGGPNVAANTQVGQENEQTVGFSSSGPEQSIVRPEARDITQTADKETIKSDTIENLTVDNTPEPWIILLLIVGWLAPSPNEIGRGIRSLFNKEEDK